MRLHRSTTWEAYGRASTRTPGSLYVAFTLVDNGNLPPGYTLNDMYDARFYVYQEGEETGFALDETDSIRSYFILAR